MGDASRRSSLLPEVVVNVVAGVFTVAAVVLVFGSHVARDAHPVDSLVDVRSVPVDYSKAARTVLVVIRSGCHACESSVPFYRALLKTAHSARRRTQFVVVAHERDKDVERYLAGQGLVPDAVVHVAAGTLRISRVPTVAIVRSDASLVGVWGGSLPPVSEKNVTKALLDDD